MSLHLIAIAIFLAIVGYVGWTFYMQYRASSATGWHRLVDAAEGSATILWAKFSIVVASFAGILASIADYLGDPAIGEAIKSNLKPQYVLAFVIVVQVITIMARKRTL